MPDTCGTCRHFRALTKQCHGGPPQVVAFVDPNQSGLVGRVNVIAQTMYPTVESTSEACGAWLQMYFNQEAQS